MDSGRIGSSGWTAFARPAVASRPAVEHASRSLDAAGSGEFQPSIYRSCVPSGFRRCMKIPRPCTSNSGTT